MWDYLTRDGKVLYYHGALTTAGRVTFSEFGTSLLRLELKGVIRKWGSDTITDSPYWEVAVVDICLLT